MCGIAGIWKKSGLTAKSSPESILSMLDQLVHRGPDSHGVWRDGIEGIELGHRRLAIVDLSPTGHQPMVSHSGRYVITLNGEIYNFEQIKMELLADSKLPPLMGTSDTEIALAAIDAWGLAKALSRFNGMFAFALWDRKQRKLFLARDRLGKKPLYYGKLADDTFVFASELKAFYPLPNFQKKISQRALSLYLELGYVPEPYSIFEKIRKLEPASFLVVDQLGDIAQSTVYWSLPEIIDASSAARENPHIVDQQYHVLEHLLEDAVRIRLNADVPLGAMLSGGVDSSLVVSLMKKISTRPIKTFSVGFFEESHNEAAFASKIAAHLKTEHEDIYVTPKDCLNTVPLIASIYDEPFADSSQIPTYLVSKLAKQRITVCLTGDGGDEFFCGYNRYIFASKMLALQKFLPIPARKLISNGMMTLSPNSWSKIHDFFTRHLPNIPKHAQVGDKIHKLSALIRCRDPLNLYSSLVQNWPSSRALLHHDLTTCDSSHEYLSSFFKSSNLSATEQMMFCDALTYLPNDILVKVDRANMAVALEGRAPLLDYRVVEAAWKMPLSSKLNARGSKWPLREILFKMVPPDLIERPKMGFGVPVAEWLRGPIKDWASELLNCERLKNQGIFRPSIIENTWSEHLSGRRNWQAKLWTILMFQAWWDETKPYI